MAYSDVLAGQLVAVTPMELTQTKRDLLLSIRTNINNQAASVTNLTTESQALLNDLDGRLVALNNANAVDVDAINATLVAIRNLQTDGDFGSTFIGMFSALYGELNAREVSSNFEKVVNTATGALEVDVSQFGFATVGEYNVQVSLSGTYPVTISYEKISATILRIYVRDHEEWEFDELGTPRLKDCSIENVVVSITISRLPVALTATITEVDGDVTTIPDGSTTAAVDTVAPDAPTLTLVGDANNIVTATGTAEADSTVAVTFSATDIVSVIADATGAYTAISTVAVETSNVTANATDAAGNTSVSVITAYTATVVDTTTNAL